MRPLSFSTLDKINEKERAAEARRHGSMAGVSELQMQDQYSVITFRLLHCFQIRNSHVQLMGNKVSSATCERWQLCSALHSAQGPRPTNEDAHIISLKLNGDPEAAFFAVFDGHVGDRAAKYAAKHFVKHLLGSI